MAEVNSFEFIKTPTEVDMNLKGANIYVTYSEIHPEGITVPTFVPPEAFVATQEGTTLKVRSADGRQGGAVNLVVGRGIIDEEGTWSLQTTGGDLSVHGSPKTQLRMGNLSAETSPDGGMSVRNIRAKGRVALQPGNTSNFHYRNIIAETLDIGTPPEK